MTKHANCVEEYEWARAPPPRLPLWQTIARGVYNPDEKSFLGRTAKRWGVMLCFYAVFYTVLGLMFAICMGGLFLTIDERRPSYTMGRSLIGVNPGVAARPFTLKGIPVGYAMDNSTEVVKQIRELLVHYENNSWSTMQKDCNLADNYGYPNNPCFFIKLNKIFDWEPACYEDPASLPEDAPSELREYITKLSPDQRKQVWVSCFFEKEFSFNVTLEYPWGMGLPAHFYPYTNQKDYHSPLVAVKLIQPPLNQLMKFRCRVWAKNINYNKSLKDPLGYTRLLLEVKDHYEATE